MCLGASNTRNIPGPREIGEQFGIIKWPQIVLCLKKLQKRPAKNFSCTKNLSREQRERLAVYFLAKALFFKKILSLSRQVIDTTCLGV